MKLLLTGLLFLLSGLMFSQNVNIPDANFKNYLLTNTAVNTNNDSEIQLSEATTFTGTLAFQFWFVSDLTGIEAFTNLTILDCGDNNLTSLDLSQNVALQQLYCYDNQLMSLDLSANENLFALDCRDNQITSLDVSDNSLLSYLNCPFNGMTNLNVSNTAMQTLRCYSNAITTLNLTNTNSSLSTLLVYNNNISDIDLSDFSALTIFECGNSSVLTNLNIANSNNTNITTFNSLNTPNLECIQVDDEIYSTANWTNIDPSTVFSENCELLNTITSNNLAVTIYPNPTTNFLNINSLEPMAFNLISLKGQKIKTGTLFKGNNTVDVSRLSMGIYIIQGKTTTGKSISFRFVKK